MTYILLWSPWFGISHTDEVLTVADVKGKGQEECSHWDPRETSCTECTLLSLEPHYEFPYLFSS
jgi:hypothetical protein